jgi:hypothetical protein
MAPGRLCKLRVEEGAYRPSEQVVLQYINIFCKRLLGPYPRPFGTWNCFDVATRLINSNSKRRLFRSVRGNVPSKNRFDQPLQAIITSCSERLLRLDLNSTQPTFYFSFEFRMGIKGLAKLLADEAPDVSRSVSMAYLGLSPDIALPCSTHSSFLSAIVRSRSATLLSARSQDCY